MKSTGKNYKLLSQRVMAATLVVASLLSGINLAHQGQASAASGAPFAQAFVRLDRLKAATVTGGRVCVKPSTANAAQTITQIKVTFPTTAATDYVVSSTVANWATTVTGLDSGQTAMPTITNASITIAGKAVTFPLTTPTVLSNANLYCFNFGAGLTTSSAGASETTQGFVESFSSGPTQQDKTIYSLSVISNDQVTTSATVPPSFQFTVSTNTDNFGSPLVPGSVFSTTGVTVGVVTNAATGYAIWAQDANAKSGKGALSSTVASYMIGGTSALGAAPHTLSGEDYGLGVTVASGSGTVDTAYVGTGTQIGSLSPSTVGFAPIASAAVPTNGDTFLCVLRARSSATTPAASDYTDTITYVGAGKF